MIGTRRLVTAGGWCRVLAGLTLCLLAATLGASARPGSLDLSFRGTGIANTPIRGYASPAAVVQQADVRLVAVGSSYGRQHSEAFTLVRYHPDGTLDPSFGRARVL